MSPSVGRVVHYLESPDGPCAALEPLLYCRRCGEVRRLAVSPPDDGPPNVATPDDLRRIAQNAAEYRRAMKED